MTAEVSKVKDYTPDQISDVFIITKNMTDDIQFPFYRDTPRPTGVKIATVQQSKPILKLMTQAFRRKLRKGLFQHAKRKKSRLV